MSYELWSSEQDTVRWWPLGRGFLESQKIPLTTQTTVSFLRITLLRKSISVSRYYDVSEKPAASIFMAEDSWYHTCALASPQYQPTTLIVHDVVVAVQQVSHQLRHLAVPVTQNHRWITSGRNKMTSFTAPYSNSVHLYSTALCFGCQHTAVLETLT